MGGNNDNKGVRYCHKSGEEILKKWILFKQPSLKKHFKEYNTDGTATLDKLCWKMRKNIES